MSAPLDTVTAKKEAEEAYKVVASYRASESMRALFAYLDARVAYCQAALVDSTDNTQQIQTKAKVLRDLRNLLSSDPAKPSAKV